MTVTTSACPLCGGGLRQASGVRRRWGLLECAGCDHVMAPAVQGTAADGEALQREHFGDAFTSTYDGWTRLWDRANARRVRRIVAGAVAPGTSVLEIGPGHGGVLSALAAAGYRVQGLELSPAVAQATSRRSGVPVRVATVAIHAREAPGAYGAIVARHVLEHMVDPVAALEAVHALLAPGGVAYVAVPNVDAPESALPGWTGYQPYHLHYFAPVRVRRVFERAGFTVLTLRTREPFSGWVNAIVNSVRGGRPAAPADSTAGPRPIVVGAYHLIRLLAGSAATPLRAVQAWSGRGEEIEILARKPEAA